MVLVPRDVAALAQEAGHDAEKVVALVVQRERRDLLGLDDADRALLAGAQAAKVLNGLGQSVTVQPVPARSRSVFW